MIRKKELTTLLKNLFSALLAPTGHGSCSQGFKEGFVLWVDQGGLDGCLWDVVEGFLGVDLCALLIDEKSSTDGVDLPSSMELRGDRQKKIRKKLVGLAKGVVEGAGREKRTHATSREQDNALINAVPKYVDGRTAEVVFRAMDAGDKKAITDFAVACGDSSVTAGSRVWGGLHSFFTKAKRGPYPSNRVNGKSAAMKPSNSSASSGSSQVGTNVVTGAEHSSNVEAPQASSCAKDAGERLHRLGVSVHVMKEVVEAVSTVGGGVGDEANRGNQRWLAQVADQLQHGMAGAGAGLHTTVSSAMRAVLERMADPKNVKKNVAMAKAALRVLDLAANSPCVASPHTAGGGVSEGASADKPEAAPSSNAQAIVSTPVRREEVAQDDSRKRALDLMGQDSDEENDASLLKTQRLGMVQAPGSLGGKLAARVHDALLHTPMSPGARRRILTDVFTDPASPGSWMARDP